MAVQAGRSAESRKVTTASMPPPSAARSSAVRHTGQRAGPRSPVPDRSRRARRSGPPEAVEGAGALFVAQSRTLVDDVELDRWSARPAVTSTVEPGRRHVERVVDEVVENLLDGARRCRHPDAVGTDGPEFDAVSAAIGAQTSTRSDVTRPDGRDAWPARPMPRVSVSRPSLIRPSRGGLGSGRRDRRLQLERGDGLDVLELES